MGKLEARRQKVLIRLRGIERLIGALGGEAPAGDGRRGRRGRRAAVAGRRVGVARRGRRRRATGRPLPEFIKDVLAKNPEGMRAKDVAQAVTRAGYKSHSKDFYGIVAATLRDTRNFKRVSRGVYRLAK
jgi:hypothetical protein